MERFPYIAAFKDGVAFGHAEKKGFSAGEIVEACIESPVTLTFPEHLAYRHPLIQLVHVFRLEKNELHRDRRRLKSNLLNIERSLISAGM
jgi:hypothetical protein